MVKRYQVFVSSTYEDLREERQKVIQALLESDCIPAGMELFTASDESQWELIKRVIDDCDYYLVIVAGRYGSMSAEGIGYTEMEYDYAVAQKKPVMGFIHESPGEIAAAKSESGDEGRKKLADFRSKVQQKMVKKWKTPGDLYGAVASSINQFKKLNSAGGWVKAGEQTSPEEVLKLRERIDALQQHIVKEESEPPVDSESLAQGADTLTYRIQYYDGREVSIEIQTTWNAIIGAIGPRTFAAADESNLKVSLIVLAKSVSQQANGALQEHSNVYVVDSDFQRIKIQLVALGLLKLAMPRDPSSTELHWVLTPFGERKVMETMAVRRAISTQS